MPCYSPIQAYRAKIGVVFSRSMSSTGVKVLLPCGQCLGCRLDRGQQWAMRMVHESKMHEDNCFITLTYAVENTPPHNSLVVADFQDFMKRLRERISPTKVRFYAAGEYGDKNGRPHYHACLFGYAFPDKKALRRSPTGEMLYSSEILSQAWGKGYTSIGEFSYKSAEYCARYIIGKSTGPDAIKYEDGYVDPKTGEVFGPRVPPFNIMSRRPGIGHSFALKYRTDIQPSDFMIRDGRKINVPRYYDKVLLDEASLAKVKAKRRRAAIPHRADQTPDRLKVREIVRRASLKSLKRPLEE